MGNTSWPKGNAGLFLAARYCPMDPSRRKDIVSIATGLFNAANWRRFRRRPAKCSRVSAAAWHSRHEDSSLGKALGPGSSLYRPKDLSTAKYELGVHP